MKKRYEYSDLARECLPKGVKSDCGIRQEIYKTGGFSMQTVTILNERAARMIGKPVGTYLTVDCGRADYLGAQERERLAHILAKEIGAFVLRCCKRAPDSTFSVLLVGLGNEALTADAVGPLTLKRLIATAHLQAEEPEVFRTLGCCALSMLAPGVLGQTGMEAGEIISSIVKKNPPDLVIAVDALAARDLERLATTIQISDAGIVPGSGIGNRRRGLTAETMGVPVIAVGVPTVVAASTLVYHTLGRAKVDLPEERMRKIAGAGDDFYVCMKECDVIVEQITKVLARAFSLALLGGLCD